MKFLSKAARLTKAREVTTKKRPLIIFNDDESGLYVKEIKKLINTLPRLSELRIRDFQTKKLSKIEPSDAIIFGDAIAPRKYDYRVVEIDDVLNVEELERHQKGFEKVL